MSRSERSSTATAGALGASEAAELLPMRRSHALTERERDLALLAWVGRFRFVTAEAAADRFGVSVQRMRARLSRLCDAGLMIAYRSNVAEPRVLYLTRRGCTLVGLPPRRPPRPDAHREHELAIISLVTALETRFTDVLTERECRRAESTRDDRFSVDVFAGGRRQRRWPDAVVVDADRRLALEIEFAPKPTSRLSAIVDAYLRGRFEVVQFLVASPALAGRLARIVQTRSAVLPPTRFATRPTFSIVPWLTVRHDEAAAIRAAVLTTGEQSSELAS